MTPQEPITVQRVSFIVPTQVPEKHTTAQLDPGDHAAGRVRLRLMNPGGVVVVDQDVDVDSDGVLAIPLPDDPAPGRWTLERGVLLRSMTLLPLRPTG